MAILMIEDEYLVAAEIRFHLERAGFFDVQNAATEADALAAIHERQWDAAIVDANLNGRGIDNIASALSAKAIPFMIVTGYGIDGIPDSVAGVPVLEKPFRPQRLVDELFRLCSRKSG